MPLYDFVCDCGHAVEVYRRVSRCSDPVMCEKCGREMYRDYGARSCIPSGKKGAYLSEALGVHPSQIDEARRRFPHHEFAPDGRMVIKSVAHRKKVLKELGYADYG